MQFNSIWPIDRTLSSAATLGHSEPGNDDNEGALRIPQSSRITGTSTSDCLVSYPGHLFGEFYPSAVGSIAPADWALVAFGRCIIIIIIQIDFQFSLSVSYNPL